MELPILLTAVTIVLLLILSVPIAAALGACYVQEVVANAAAVRALYPEVRTAVELGGQDAKVIFFRYDEASGKLQTSDMRMNGSCAGGTGAFIDQMAALLEEIQKEIHKVEPDCRIVTK